MGCAGGGDGHGMPAVIDFEFNNRHGGNLQAAVRRYGIERGDWLDLSTGIAPWGWPVPSIPADVWQRLPEAECPLQQPAAAYYGCDPQAVLAVPGSQFAIQTLPTLLSPRRVAIPVLGYFEHRKAWQSAGHQLVNYGENEVERVDQMIEAGALDVVLVINPNNPSAARLEKTRLLKWRESLSQRGGLMIVDEAFMDAAPGESLAPACPRSGLVVLRSLGKFFGLAGLRLGFVLGDAGWLQKLQAKLGPWAVNGPAQYAGSRALADRDWQRGQRQRLNHWLPLQRQLLESIGRKCGWRVRSGPLFISLRLANTQAQTLADHLGQKGILVRRFVGPGAEPGCVRLGLVKDAIQLERLQLALEQFTHCRLQYE